MADNIADFCKEMAEAVGIHLIVRAYSGIPVEGYQWEQETATGKWVRKDKPCQQD